VGIVLLILLAKAPGVLRNIFDRPKPQKAPVRIHEHQLQSIERLMREAQRPLPDELMKRTEGQAQPTEDDERPKEKDPSGEAGQANPFGRP
jgi:hypothetical protein